MTFEENKRKVTPRLRGSSLPAHSFIRSFTHSASCGGSARCQAPVLGRPSTRGPFRFGLSSERSQPGAEATRGRRAAGTEAGMGRGGRVQTVTPEGWAGRRERATLSFSVRGIYISCACPGRFRTRMSKASAVLCSQDSDRARSLPLSRLPWVPPMSSLNAGPHFLPSCGKPPNAPHGHQGFLSAAGVGGRPCVGVLERAGHSLEGT